MQISLAVTTETVWYKFVYVRVYEKLDKRPSWLNFSPLHSKKHRYRSNAQTS